MPASRCTSSTTRTGPKCTTTATRSRSRKTASRTGRRRRRSSTRRRTRRAPTADSMPEEPAAADQGAVLRRAPFSDNPRVGVRGQRTQQRILDAALRVFGEVGYHQCSIDTITKLAGCSRVSFYQYFESKEDVFRLLAVQVARQLNASTDLLEPVTADSAGWDTLRAWVGRYAEIYARYEPIFTAFPAAAESDTMLIGDSIRTANRYLSGLGSRVTGSTLTGPRPDHCYHIV